MLTDLILLTALVLFVILGIIYLAILIEGLMHKVSGWWTRR